MLAGRVGQITTATTTATTTTTKQVPVMLPCAWLTSRCGAQHLLLQLTCAPGPCHQHAAAGTPRPQRGHAGQHSVSSCGDKQQQQRNNTAQHLLQTALLESGRLPVVLLSAAPRQPHARFLVRLLCSKQRTHVLPSLSTANRFEAASTSRCAHSKWPCFAATIRGVRRYRSRALTVCRSRLNDGSCTSACCCCCCCCRCCCCCCWCPEL